MTYEQRVEAAAKTYANSYNSYDGYESPKQHVDFTYEGIKAIAMQAEAIKEVLTPNHTAEYIDNLLKDYGYRTEKEEEL